MASENGIHFLVTQRIEIGQSLFVNQAELIPKDDLTSRKFILDVHGKYFLPDAENHFMYRGYAEMLGKIVYQRDKMRL